MNKTAIEFLTDLRPAIPMSAERSCTVMSGGELRRTIQKGAVLFNGETVAVNEIIDFPVFSLVFFQNSKRKTTLL